MGFLVCSNPYADLRSRVCEQLVAALYNISLLIVEVEQMMDQLFPWPLLIRVLDFAHNLIGHLAPSLNLTTSYIPLKPSPTIHKNRRIRNEERERDDCRIDNFVHCLERLQLPARAEQSVYALPKL